MFTAGIDIGSTITKIVIKNETELRANVITPTGAEHRRLAHQVMRDVLANSSLSFEEIDYIVATGYGRINVPFADQQVTEITCHMRGVPWLFLNVRTIIDIGGQDSKGKNWCDNPPAEDRSGLYDDRRGGTRWRVRSDNGKGNR